MAVQQKPSENQLIKPPPPPHLSKETLIIWEGWSKMGDREMARESATKGSHTDLAVMFLSQRKGQSLDEATAWFNTEIRFWASELLSNKQVFKASHILTNVKLDPTTEIRQIFVSTCKQELRDFLGNHLSKIGVIDDDVNGAWELLKIVDEVGFQLTEKPTEITVNHINGKDLVWKSKIAAQLFLQSQNYSLLPLLTPHYLWKYSVRTKNVDVTSTWINSQYSEYDSEPELQAEFKTLLKQMTITDEMLQFLYNDKNTDDDFKSTICDQLAKFGIFSSQEKNDLCKVITRISNVEMIHSLDELLGGKYSTINVDEFWKLVIAYCVDNEFYILLEVCTKSFRWAPNSELTALICSHRDVATNLNDKKTLENNFLLSTKYLRYNRNLQIDSVVKIFFLLLRNENTLFNVLYTPKLAFFEIDADSILKNLPVLHTVFNKFMKNSCDDRLSVYDLLSRHVSLIPSKVFRYRFSKDRELPHFNLEGLVQAHGHEKSVNYKYFIMRNRPSTATALALKGSTEGIEDRVTKIAVKNFLRKDIVSSCVAFLEMIAKNSEPLRVNVTAIDTIYMNGEVVEEELVAMFLCDDKRKGLKTFEDAVYADLKIDNETTCENIVNAIKSFEIVAKFADNHQLPMPDYLPRKFAENDLWLPFLTHIQKYGYGQAHVCKLVQHFNDKRLLEHVLHCLTHDIHYEQKNAIMGDRDSRNYFLSRIGVRKNFESDPMTASVNSGSSYGSTSSSGLSDMFEVELFDMKNVDLLQLLIKCHNSGDPPKALLHACLYYKYPLFAILATSYEPDSVITNWLTWLAVMCNVENISSYEGMALVGSDITNFLKMILQNGYYKTLQESFNIFLFDSPLNKFMTVLGDCLSLNFKIDNLRRRLERFHKIMLFKRSNSFMTQIDHDMSYFDNRLWIESTALVLLAGTLQHNFETIYNKIQFLTVITELDLKQYFSIQLPDFATNLEILRYLFERRISVHMDFFKLCDVVSYRDEVVACIVTLTKKGMFEEALRIAEIADMAADLILVEKWKQKFSNGEFDEFWSKCDAELRLYKMIPKNAVIFYTNFTLASKEDKYRMLKLAYNWAFEHKIEEEQELEHDMWKVYLKLDDTYTYELYECSNLKLYADMKTELSKITFEDSCTPLTSQEKCRLDGALNQLLQAGNVFQAFKLEKMFNHTHSNIEILRLCFSLAEGLKLPFQLTAHERVLVRKGGNFRTFSHRMKTLRSTRLSSLSSVSRSPGGLSVGTVLEMETEMQDTLALIENLTDGLTSGEEIAQNILMTYRISVNTEKKYNSILEAEDPEVLLVESLNGDCRNKLEVVHDYILVYKWTKQKIADFLCEQIITMIVQSTERNQNFSELWDVNLDTDIHVILQLLPDTCSILGNKLYSYAATMHKSQSVSSDYPNVNQITQVVELLIRAHDCYTADCNMEGISVILKKCQTLINLLLTMKNWKLIVRLLTGVGRYNEMNYAFHILRENDQFEYLLRRGKSNIKDNGLKVALLEYLKRYCPDNRELYRMVALHFTLYSEVAQLWENESASIIRNLIAISKLEMQNRKVNPDTCLFVHLTNTDGTRICLKKAMENYSHAAEYHLQGEKLAKAMNAARQAELIALQISLLKSLTCTGTASCVLNLSSTQISTLIMNELNFPQALILTEAYEHQTDWAAVLYEQYILNNRVGYLANFLSVFPLTDALVQDISRRFLAANINSETSINNMKGVLKVLSSVHTKYRVASELGFLDIVEDLLNGDSLMYLKDTVWKKGYKG